MFSRLPALAPGALLSFFLAALPAPAQEPHWPFGTDPRGRMGGFRRLDLYNLGLIGAKASAPGASMGGPRSGMRVGRGGRGGKDLGPSELEIKLLFPGGPAAKAQLEPGDVIVGVGKRPFGEAGALGPLALAICKAEASSKRRLTLLVRKKGAAPNARPELVPVRLPGSKARKHFARPARTKARYEIAMAACRWLADRQSGDGGFPETLSGNNGAVVQACMAGLAWLASGSDLQRGPFSANLTKAAKFVMRHHGSEGAMGGRMRGGSNWNQSTWGEAHAAIFLGELQLRTPSGGVKVELQKIVDSLVERQEGTGGYAHGPGGANALGYTELNIQTALVLCGLGLAQQAGAKVPEEAVKKAVAYIELCSSGDGGVGYSHKPGQKGQGNIGRTAGCWLGFRALGLKNHPHTLRMQKWSARHIDGIMGGHASLMQHIFFAGLAAQAQGKVSEKKYWETLERDLVLAQAPDGSLQPRPWHESLSMGSNSDVTFGEVWTTASWACVLAAKPARRGKKGGLGLLTPGKRR